MTTKMVHVLTYNFIFTIELPIYVSHQHTTAREKAVDLLCGAFM